MDVHTEEKPFTCQMCGSAFSQLLDLKEHMCIHSGEKSFSENSSEAEHSEEANLRQTPISTNITKFPCHICGSSFSPRSKLRRHMRSHTGEKPFGCRICGAAFPDKSKLRRHIRMHTGEKPFPCQVCGTSFSQPSGLKEHIRVHTGERPFSCQVCGAAFARTSTLKDHMNRHKKALGWNV